jgi:putative ABC transport system substrate-binding protein
MLPSNPAQRASAFRDGMVALGWVEGRDIAYEYRYGGELPNLEALARELVTSNVEVVVAFGTEASLAARRATDRVPIVMAASSDPLADKLVASLARPGGNVTGVSLMVPDIAVKQLEILKYGIPNLKRAAILQDGTPAHERIVAQLRALAPQMRLEVASYIAARENDLPQLFQELSGAGAIVVLPSPIIDRWRGRIGELAIQHRLPSMGGWRVYAGAGLLFAYAATLSDMQRRAAAYVDKILKGARPGDLPIEQPSKFELVINLNTAWALGLTIPPDLLARADEVIE